MWRMCSRSRRSCQARRTRRIRMITRGRGSRGMVSGRGRRRRVQGRRRGGPIRGSMAFDFNFTSIISNAGRLRILAALAREQGQEFVRLREVTRLTDGNLSAHARRLSEAGFVLIEKKFREGKPVTLLSITQAGKYAIQQHARELLEAVEAGEEGIDEEWVD